MGFPEAASSFRIHQIEAAPARAVVSRFKAKETEKKSEEEWEKFTSRMNTQWAFFQDKLKITRNMSLAMKLQSLQLQGGKARL
ncbi:unnamed protein product [Nyctereutes procyonoides]|uniref:(raccoon dog) hypothetical protein n=1 Tax=Nyctereutes procyonoides TaxID=34880 RepID=A0A811Z977_NYCPR|nr:unnamed protein product [Nyctereutes procyonoides]